MIVNSLIMALCLVVFVGQLVVIAIIYRQGRRKMLGISIYAQKKKEHFEAVAKGEKDEKYALCYEALANAYRQVQATAEREIEKW